MRVKNGIKSLFYMMMLSSICAVGLTGCTLVGMASIEQEESNINCEIVEETVIEEPAVEEPEVVEESEDGSESSVICDFSPTDESGVIGRVEIGVYGRVTGIVEEER